MTIYCADCGHGVYDKRDAEKQAREWGWEKHWGEWRCGVCASVICAIKSLLSTFDKPSDGRIGDTMTEKPADPSPSDAFTCPHCKQAIEAAG